MIIAIGGGDIAEHKTYAIDKFIVDSTHKPNPHLLFIPTASNDAPGYIAAVAEVYESLGCTVDALCLYSGTATSQEAQAKISAADIIYVGGGNTESMMNTWREFHVDEYLTQAYLDDKVLCGLSAGSICWYIAGHSDSEFIAKKPNAKNKWVRGLGFIPYLHCPHYDEPERAEFDEFFKGQITDAIAVENQVAIVWDKQRLSVISANPDQYAYRLHWNGTAIHKEMLKD